MNRSGIVVGLLAILVSACGALPKPHLTAGEVSSDGVPRGHARIFFYGDNFAWRRVDRLWPWKPGVTVDGEPVPAVNGKQVVFYVDVAAGAHTIGVNNDVQEGDPPVPLSYPGREVSLEVAEGERHYVRLVMHGTANYIPLEPRQHYLEVSQVQGVLGEIEITQYKFAGTVKPANWGKWQLR